MDYDTKKAEWSELNTQLKVLKEKKTRMQADLKEKQMQLYIFEDRMAKEAYDVEALNKSSLTSFWTKISGTYEQKYEKEYREYMQAKWDYDALSQEISLLKEDIDKISDRIETAREKCEQIAKELSENFPEQNEWKAEEESEREQLLLQKKELEEAIAATDRTISLADQAIKKFSSADGWALMDVLGGGLLSDICKYGAIDSAQEIMNQMKVASKQMEKELADVDVVFEDNWMEIDSMTKGLDIFFDNIFTDLTVRNRIKDNLYDLKEYRDKLEALYNHLYNKLKDIEEQL